MNKSDIYPLSLLVMGFVAASGFAFHNEYGNTPEHDMVRNDVAQLLPQVQELHGALAHDPRFSSVSFKTAEDSAKNALSAQWVSVATLCDADNKLFLYQIAAMLAYGGSEPDNKAVASLKDKETQTKRMTGSTGIGFYCMDRARLTTPEAAPR